MLRQGARKKGGTVLIVHVRLQAILASLVMPHIVPSRIALARRGSLWALEHYLLFWRQHDC